MTQCSLWGSKMFSTCGSHDPRRTSRSHSSPENHWCRLTQTRNPKPIAMLAQWARVRTDDRARAVPDGLDRWRGRLRRDRPSQACRAFADARERRGAEPITSYSGATAMTRNCLPSTRQASGVLRYARTSPGARGKRLRNEYGRYRGITRSISNPAVYRCSSTERCVSASVWSAQSKYSRAQYRKFGPRIAIRPPLGHRAAETNQERADRPPG